MRTYSCTPLRVVSAGVLLEVLLRNSVECERGNRTFQARSGHTPMCSRRRFARKTARTRPWCAVEHRVIDWASCSSLIRGVRSNNHDQVWIEEMHGRIENPDLNDYRASLGGHGTSSIREKALSSECTGSVRLKALDSRRPLSQRTRLHRTRSFRMGTGP